MFRRHRATLICAWTISKSRRIAARELCYVTKRYIRLSRSQLEICGIDLDARCAVDWSYGLEVGYGDGSVRELLLRL
jgi:hypothetical protein